MKNLIFAIVGLFLFSTCTCKKCRYNAPVKGIFVLDWFSHPKPNKGIVYMFKKDTHFSVLIDSTRSFTITRCYPDSSTLACLFQSKQVNHQMDIRLILNDTLIYDISNITLSWVVDYKHWTLGAPTEHCSVVSLRVNRGNVYDTLRVVNWLFHVNMHAYLKGDKGRDSRERI